MTNNTFTLNRRSFLSSIAAVGGTLLLNRATLAQSLPSSLPSSPADQSAAVRAAAQLFLQTLSADHRNRLTFAFPKGQTPGAIGFSNRPRGFGGPGNNNNKPRRDVSFDADGHLKTTNDSDHGPGGPAGFRGPHGPGGPGGPGGPHSGGPMAAGEKFGQAVWTNFPVDNVARPGMQMGQFTPAERAAAHALLQTVLSPMGYQKINDIMAADQLVADSGSDYAAGFDVYTLGLFGQPHPTNPWMLQFGGHHLGLNVIFVADQAVAAPLHTGCLPTKFDSNGKTIRALGNENDKAFDLIAALNPEQLKSATIDHDISDLIFGPGSPDAHLEPQGLLASEMTPAQQKILFSLITEWVGVLNESHAAPRLQQIRKSLNDTRFAWSGPTTHQPNHNGKSYFRIHGPSLLIEHAPQGNQGGPQVHVHTIMRDLTNDYAKQWTA